MIIIRIFGYAIIAVVMLPMTIVALVIGLFFGAGQKIDKAIEDKAGEPYANARDSLTALLLKAFTAFIVIGLLFATVHTCMSSTGRRGGGDCEYTNSGMSC